MNKNNFYLAILTVLVLAGCTKNLKETTLPENISGAANGNAISEMANTGKMVPNEILVKFVKGTSNEARMKALERIGGNVAEKILTRAMQRGGDNDGVYLIHTPMAALEASDKIRGQEVEFAEPNFIYQHSAVSNDTYYTNGSLWGMYGSSTSPANQYGSGAGAAWAAEHTGSATVFVGIIDEGAMYYHEDLSGNFGNPNEIAGNDIDDDGNGFIDDTYGWDFEGNNNSTFDGTGDDHGTHVAGTIGAIGGNGIGVAGLNWNVKMLSAKFLGRRGGTTANAIKAVDYFTDLKIRGLNIVATNNSWGGGGFSQALQDAIERANGAGILFIAAAGNNGVNIDASASYPAGYTNANIISVAAIDKTGGIASFSNYGVTQVDLGAPGVAIYSTLPGGKGKTITSTYGSYSGTSMATPHVTGAAALYLSTHPGATAPQIKTAILSSVTPTSSLSGKTVTGGRLNVSGF